MPFYSSTPTVNVIQNTYEEYPVHVTSINLPKLAQRHFAYPPNTLVYSGSHDNIPENTYIFSSLAVSDGRVANCYRYSLFLKITLTEGGKANANPPFDLVVIAKLHKQFRKDDQSVVGSKKYLFPCCRQSTTTFYLCEVKIKF